MPTHKGEHPCTCTELSFKRKDGISCVTWLACVSGWFRLLNYLKLKLAFKRVLQGFNVKANEYGNVQERICILLESIIKTCRKCVQLFFRK